jgi:hypothetical protein
LSSDVAVALLDRRVVDVGPVPAMAAATAGEHADAVLDLDPHLGAEQR